MNFRDGTIYGQCVQKVYKELITHFDPVNSYQVNEVIDRLANWKNNIYLVNKLLENSEQDSVKFRPNLLDHLNWLDNQGLEFPINKEQAARQLLKVLLEAKRDHEEGLNKPF